MDDTLVIWPHDPVVLHDHLNSQHPAIQFTMEEQSEGHIPFLDTLVRKEGAEVKTSVYRKPTDIHPF